MDKSPVISFRVDEQTLATIDRLATAQDRSRAWLVRKIIREAAERELALLDSVDEGIADFDAGRTITHDELIAPIEARRAGREAA